MPWHCTYHPARPAAPQIGDMWPAPQFREALLSDAYLRDRKPLRPPLVVRLPGGADFCVDGCYLPKGPELRLPPRGQRSGWGVTGEPPLITVVPAIHCLGYHGWLTHGVLTDDLDGRNY